MTKNLYRLFSLISFLFFLLLLVTIGKDAIHTNHLAAKRPKVSQPELGLTIPFQAGARTVYISREDYQRDQELENYRMWSAAALCLFGLVSLVFEHSKRKAPSRHGDGAVSKAIKLNRDQL
jgi:hypothetical protein